MAQVLLSPAALAQHSAIIGKTGSGKTYAAKLHAERLLADKARVCIIDPTGAWWGLRQGFPIVIFGGDHGDVPINVQSAAPAAAIIADRVAAAIIDLSEMMIGDRHQFMTDFAAELYRLNRRRLHLIIDEADEFMPQQPMPDMRRMLHHCDRIVRRGRIRGFAVMLITQRPAVLHKNVLTQANAMIAMRLTSPQDRKAFRAWIEGQADAKKGAEVIDALPGLKRGEGWVWEPERNRLQLVRFPKIKTFDSSRAPDAAEPIIDPDQLWTVDVEALRAEFAAAQAEAEADDPKALRRRIAELERDARRAGQPIIDGAHLAAARREGAAEARAAIRPRLDLVLDTISDLAAKLTALRGDAAELLPEVEAALSPPSDGGKARKPAAAAPARASLAELPPPVIGRRGGDDPKQAILNSLAWLASIGLAPADRSQVALLAGASPKSSSYGNNLGALRSAGLIDYPPGQKGKVALTLKGGMAAKKMDRPPTTADLHAVLERQLPTAKWRILSALIDTYPDGLAKDDLAARAGASAKSSSFGNNLGSLRTLGLIEYPGPGRAVARSVLFIPH